MKVFVGGGRRGRDEKVEWGWEDDSVDKALKPTQYGDLSLDP